MVKKRFHFSLQTKIMGLIAALLVFVIGVLTITLAVQHTQEERRQAEQLAVQTARTISYMPPAKELIERKGGHAAETQDVIEQMKEQTGAYAIYILDEKGDIRSASGKSGLEKLERSREILFGGSHVSATKADGRRVIRGSAPIMKEQKGYSQVIGSVSVDFLQTETEQSIKKHLRNLSVIAVLVLLLGFAGAAVLAKSIRKDTLGLEPHEIAALYRERNAMLLAIREGIIATNREGVVTMMNVSAAEMLRLPEPVIHLPIDEVMPGAGLMSVLEQGEIPPNQEVSVNDQVFIINTKVMNQGGQAHGIVVSFREKTELKKLIDTLTEVRKYSEDLRAQTHEFSNKLYAILGLLELGEYDEAIDLIKEEYAIQNEQHDLLFHNIHSQQVQAILLGKISKASEKKVKLVIDENSSLAPLPAHIGLSHLITIIGNLIDNAFEAVAEQRVKEVLFFITDMGRDIVIEVSDTGTGVPPDKMEAVFERGYSSKGMKRGYGLANVKDSVRELGGWIELANQKTGGAVFTVFIPKEKQGGNPFDSHRDCGG
ncbi:MULTISPECIES: two-component sensor histidine kinase CitS [unclassified Bacillus (in: firmicutes)]|uniref:two-component sensor histidine kinase CitS n=1 Tax=unclassified Bacillus (in: firmicutes) TaxID=185979 RepID=UPI0011CB195A|nr:MULTISPECIES: two-component sensor histidine kinase CitS [unclassified Bacillus (in: firmicutes)]MDN0193165.1 two-component sensor histidine kinase CitS [Bacillus sp. B.PNR1]MDN3035165.1 two-component sensor histidine kinase CitS [Bacillus sp. B.PNR2]TXF66940.1 sensor histidine kinase [Bacillus subtilis]